MAHKTKRRRNPSDGLESSLHVMKSGERVVLGGIGVERKGGKYNIAHLDRKSGSIKEFKGLSASNAASKLSAWEGARGKVRSNPDPEALERLKRARGRAEAALVKTDSSSREYEQMRRDIYGERESKAKKAARGAARLTRAGVTEFPLTAVIVTTVVAGFIGYQIGKPSATSA